MKRSPLQRRTRLRPRRSTPRRSPRVYDDAYRAWVRRQPCAARDLPGHRCDGPIEGDHAGRRGLGYKADDDTMIALCTRAHRERTDFAGLFRAWSQETMRSWLEAQIDHHRARYAAHLQRLEARRRTLT